MGLKLANNATSTLATSIGDSDTNLDVQAGDAGLFPALGAGDWFPLTLVDASGNVEVMKVTARSGTTMTVTRAQEGTSAIAFDAGTRVDLRLTAATAAALFETVHEAGAKATPIDADEIGLLDSAAGYVRKTLSWENMTAGVWAALGALITGGTEKVTPADNDHFVIADSAVSDDSKKISYSDLKNDLRTKFDPRRNRIVNPCMQVSQENGNNAGTATGYHAADQWRSQHASDGAISFQRVAAVTPAGAHYRLRLSVTTADAALSAGQFLSIQQKLEASRVRDFLFGSANARPGVLRFGIKAPAGTYGLAILNADSNRCFVAEVVVAAGEANTDVIKEIAFAGDTTGTWETGDVYGWSLNITFASGSTYQGTVGWQAGGYLTTANQTNGLASTANVFEIFDVGLRLDPDGTGVYGQFEVPEYGQVLRDCQRYYEIVGAVAHTFSSPVVSGNVYFKGTKFATIKRAAPTMSFTNAGANGFPTTTYGNAATVDGFYESRQASATTDQGYFQSTCEANARM